MKDIKIIVAAHKKYDMPDNNLYLPVFVGADGKEDISGYKRDDTVVVIFQLKTLISVS